MKLTVTVYVEENEYYYALIGSKGYFASPQDIESFTHSWIQEKAKTDKAIEYYHKYVYDGLIKYANERISCERDHRTNSPFYTYKTKLDYGLHEFDNNFQFDYKYEFFTVVEYLRMQTNELSIEDAIEEAKPEIVETLRFDDCVWMDEDEWDSIIYSDIITWVDNNCEMIRGLEFLTKQEKELFRKELIAEGLIFP